MLKKIRLTIRQKLSLLLVVFVIYPAILVSVFGYFKYANDIKTELMKSLNDRISRVSDRTVELFEETKRFAMMLPYDNVLNDIFVKRGDGAMTNQATYNNITDYLYSKFYSIQGIQAFYFCFTDSPNTVYMVNPDNLYYQYKNDIHPIILSESGKLDQYGYYISDTGDIYIIRKMYDRFTFKQYGIISIKIDKGFMLKSFTDEFKNDASFLVLNNGKDIFEGGTFKDKNAVITAMQDYTNGNNANKASAFKPDEFVNGTLSLDNINLQYGIFIPLDGFMARYYDALKLLVVLTIGMAIATLLIAIPLKNGIMTPIKRLTELMKHLGEGNLGVQAKWDDNDEFKVIYDSFNNMSSEIKYLFDVVYKEELARKEAQLIALQARINPHFLYNTLEIMNWKARIHGNNELSEMIEALGTLMDASMDKGGDGICRLSDEMRLIESYIYIMNKRFGKRIEFFLDIDETLKDVRMPKLIIQPLLENAVMHGIEPVGGGIIILSVQQSDDGLAIEVTDNGAGMDEKDIEEYNRLFNGETSKFSDSTGIGIRNVNERIKLLYGEMYSLTLRKGEPGGTVAMIHIPRTIPEQKRPVADEISEITEITGIAK